VSEELDHLWALHLLDDEAAALEAVLRRLPAQRADSEQHVRIERTALEALRSKLAELQRSRRAVEKEIEAQNAEERKFQSQLPAIKKNEEYTALLHEISAVREKRSALETDVLMKMEDEEAGARRIPALEKSLADAERDAAHRLERLALDEAAAREKLGTLQAARVVHLDVLPPATRSRYERVHASPAGRAVVPVSKGACGGCFRSLPPQALQEVKRRDRITTCEGCGRLLVWPPEGA
jgi:uncharacterized protein